MSLRNVKAQNQSARAARRKNALQRATGPVVSATESKWETLENRLLMTLVHEYKFNEDPNVDPTPIVDELGTNNGNLENYIGDTPDNATPGVYRPSTGGSPAGGGYLHFEALNGTAANGADTYQNSGWRVILDHELKGDIGGDSSVVAWLRLTPDASNAIGSDTPWRAPSIVGVEQQN